MMRVPAALLLLALLGVGVAVAAPIELDGPFAVDNCRLAAEPMKACVGGVWSRVSATNPSLNVASIRVSVAGKTVKIPAPGFGGEWRACFHKPFEASTDRYDLTVVGLGKTGLLLVFIAVKQVSFGDGLVHDGQSHNMVPLAAAIPFAGDLTLTNYTRILDEWAANQYYHTTFMATTSVGAAAFSSVPLSRFGSVLLNWTRWDAPNFRSLLTNTLGWQAVCSCMEHAMRTGKPTHCIQIAVATTSIKAHMPNTTHAQSGMISPKPFTSAASELIQSPGGLWNGVKVPLKHWQATRWIFAQGEADWATAGEYGTLLGLFWQSLYDMVDGVRALVGYKNKDTKDAEGPTYTHFSTFLLGSYEGHSTAPPSQNPPFNVTALAQQGAVRRLLRMSVVVHAHLSYFSMRDGGLHTVDTWMQSAIDDQNQYQNRVYGESRVVTPPEILAGVVTAWDTLSGLTTIELSFVTANGLGIDWLPVPRPAAVQSKVWQYRQFNNPLYSIGVAQSPTVTVVAGASVPTLRLTMTVERPSFGVPTTLVYTILSDFLQSAIAYPISSVAPHPHWPHRIPLPCSSFSLELTRSPDIVITSTPPPAAPAIVVRPTPAVAAASEAATTMCLPTSPPVCVQVQPLPSGSAVCLPTSPPVCIASPSAAPLSAPATSPPLAPTLLVDGFEVDPEWADIVALQALSSNAPDV